MMTRVQGVVLGSVVCGLAACSSGPVSGASAEVAPPAAGGATASGTLLYFEGSVDVVHGTMEVVTRLPGSDRSTPEATLPYGTGTGDVYFHTCSTASTASTYGGGVTAINRLGSITNLNAVIDAISGTGVTLGSGSGAGSSSGIIASYGSVGTSTVNCTSPVTWTFNVQSSTNFTFLGHADGTLLVTQVNLASAFTTDGIVLDGQTDPTVGLDGSGHSFSSNKLDVTSAWASGTIGTANGVPFSVVFPTSSDVANSIWCKGQTVSLPAGNYSNLSFLGVNAGVTSSGQSGTFTVTYTDSTTATLTQSMSDALTNSHYSGETLAATTADLDTGSGGVLASGSGAYLYEYNIALNPAKTVSSITLPNLGSTKGENVIAITLH